MGLTARQHAPRRTPGGRGGSHTRGPQAAPLPGLSRHGCGGFPLVRLGSDV
jgi:hypothetical protein